MRKIKHSKFRNSGILFELLVRQITADILNGSDSSKANKLLQKYFKETTELGKESKLYQLMIQEKAKDSNQADHLVELILKSRKKLSNQELSRQKFELIKEIQATYPIDDFLRGSISNYKLLASIYKVFEEATSSSKDFDPKEIFQARNFIVEHICVEKKKPLDESKKDELIEFYQKQESDLRLLSYKLLIDSFNKKYSSLDNDQKKLLREYINNISNTNSLREYMNAQVPLVKEKLVKCLKSITDSVIKIKLSEAIHQLDKIADGKLVKDNQVVSLLLAYELCKELSNTTQK